MSALSSDDRARPDVAVILVGLNAKRFVLGCLHSLEAADWGDVSYEVVYIDNGSSDGSAAAVRESFPAVRVIENPTNVGFCPAANQGARATDARYYYFINDDTEVIGNAIALLVEYMDGHRSIGTCGSRLVYPDGTEQYSGRRFPNVWSSVLGRRSFLSRYLPNVAPLRDYLCKEQLAQGEPFEVDWVSAAGQIVRREAFDDVGGYAEDYYYWHEAVFCSRLVRKGWRVVLHPDSRVVHYEGQGSGARPPRVRRFHIVDFHRGAYRCWTELYGSRRFHPARWLVAAGLFARGSLMWLATYLPAARGS